MGKNLQKKVGDDGLVEKNIASSATNVQVILKYLR